MWERVDILCFRVFIMVKRDNVEWDLKGLKCY